MIKLDAKSGRWTFDEATEEELHSILSLGLSFWTGLRSIEGTVLQRAIEAGIAEEVLHGNQRNAEDDGEDVDDEEETMDLDRIPDDMFFRDDKK